MGTWGTEPWDNDEAADWFGETLEKSRLPEKVREALRLDVELHHATVRAAAWLLGQLCRPYVWPGDLDADLQAGIDALKSLIEHPDYAEQEEVLTAEIEELRSRLAGGDRS